MPLYRKSYGFYARNGFSYRQFIPCLDPLGEERGQHPWSLTPKLYARYLKDSFDSWYRDIREGHKTYHRYFDNLLLIMDGQWPEACGMGGICGRQFVIEADGSVYPCDFYMLDEYCIGNFSTDDFETVEKIETLWDSSVLVLFPMTIAVIADGKHCAVAVVGVTAIYLKMGLSPQAKNLLKI